MLGGPFLDVATEYEVLPPASLWVINSLHHELLVLHHKHRKPVRPAWILSIERLRIYPAHTGEDNRFARSRRGANNNINGFLAHSNLK
jgi:hypothetical protein